MLLMHVGSSISGPCKESDPTPSKNPFPYVDAPHPSYVDTPHPFYVDAPHPSYVDTLHAYLPMSMHLILVSSSRARSRVTICTV